MMKLTLAIYEDMLIQVNKLKSTLEAAIGDPAFNQDVYASEIDTILAKIEGLDRVRRLMWEVLRR